MSSLGSFLLVRKICPKNPRRAQSPFLKGSKEPQNFFVDWSTRKTKSSRNMPVIKGESFNTNPRGLLGIGVSGQQVRPRQNTSFDAASRVLQDRAIPHEESSSRQVAIIDPTDGVNSNASTCSIENNSIGERGDMSANQLHFLPSLSNQNLPFPASARREFETCSQTSSTLDSDRRQRVIDMLQDALDMIDWERANSSYIFGVRIVLNRWNYSLEHFDESTLLHSKSKPP